MKKIIIAVLVATMIFAAIVPLSATAESPVKDYASAQDGELLYTLNFNGDDAFTPAPDSSAATCYEYIPSQDGKSLTVKGVPGAQKTVCFYGGSIAGLEATANTKYTMTYKVKANGTGDKDNSVGIGGWLIDGDFRNGYNNYSNHNTNDTANRRASLSKSYTKIFTYVMFSKLAAFDTDADGFVTMMLEFNVEAGKFTSYILKKDATDINVAESWIKIEQQNMSKPIDDTTPDSMGFTLYSCYNVVDTTIKDVKIYKNAIFEHTVAPESTAATTKPASSTKAKTTAKATTVDATTVAPTEAPATDAPAESSGCGSSIALSGVAMIATVGTITAFVTRKKDD